MPLAPAPAQEAARVLAARVLAARVLAALTSRSELVRCFLWVLKESLKPNLKLRLRCWSWATRQVALRVVVSESIEPSARI
jgi:hypothetical protein